MSASRNFAIINRDPRGLEQSPKVPGAVVDENGGMYISREQLEKFGEGNASWARRELRAFLATDRTGPTPSKKVEYPKTVRLATLDDEANVLELLLIDLNENAVMIAPIDEDRVMETIQIGTRQRGGYVGVIDGKDKKPVAVTILHPCQWWWSRGWYYAEAVTFVHPDHRGGHNHDALLAFGQWATQQQTKVFGYTIYFMCGVLGLNRFLVKTAMYRRKFMQVGSAFLWPSLNGGRRT